MGTLVSMDDERMLRTSAEAEWEGRCYRALVDLGMVPEVAAERSPILRAQYQKRRITPEAAARDRLHREGWLLESESEE